MPTTVNPDLRLILARPDLADARLQGLRPARHYAATEALRCLSPSASLRAAPADDAEQMTQLLFGETLEVLEVKDGWAFGQGVRDRYAGYVREDALGAALQEPPSHWVSALRTWVLAEADLKSPVLALLSMNALVRVEDEDGRWRKIEGSGWVFAHHLSPIGVYRDDPAAVALQFLGAPYLWGGRESLGLDCSGLIQNALQACGLSCPRDSDMQFAELGEPIERGDLARGDLVFWDGHVGIMSDKERLIDANGYQMAVTHGVLEAAITRREGAGLGPVTGYRRLVRL